MKEMPSNKKVSTSCDEKVESCNDSDSDIYSDDNESEDYCKDDDNDLLPGVNAIAMGFGMLTISDNKLFKDPPPKEDCPICMLPIPHSEGICGVSTVYMACCGKIICCGCSMAEDDEIKKGNIKPWCALCRVPIHKSNEEYNERLMRRMKLNDDEAFYSLGHSYRDGDYGLPQDFNKATELWQKAAELGSICAHYNIARDYHLGEGVEEDTDKAMYHFKLAAIGGHESARHFLGCREEANSNITNAMKHFMIAARAGYEKALKKVGEGYKCGHVTKDQYASTLRAYQVSIDEMKSKERAKAAAQR